MFELKYKITDADLKRLNKSVMWKYFIPYLLAALAGIGIGIAAAVLRPRTDILVFGIILAVLGSLLLVCSLLLVILPKNFVVSALLTSDDIERELVFGDNEITVKTAEQSDMVIRYGEIRKLQNKKTELVAYIGKDIVLIIKDAITSGQSLGELYAFVMSKIKPTSAPVTQQPSAEKEEQADQSNESTVAAEEVTDDEKAE